MHSVGLREASEGLTRPLKVIVQVLGGIEEALRLIVQALGGIAEAPYNESAGLRRY